MSNSNPPKTNPNLHYAVAARKGWIRPVSQARSREMVDRILDAANQVFAKHGFDATKISDIAHAAGCSVGIFYKRFRDKEGLFYTLQYRHIANSRRRMDRLLAAADSQLSTNEVLLRFIRGTVKNVMANAGFERALVEQSLRDRRVWKAQRKFNDYAGDRLVDFLIDRSEIAKADEDLRQRGRFAVRIVFSSVVNLVVLGPGPYAATDPRVVDTLAEILRGWLHEEQDLVAPPQRLGKS